MLPARWMKLPCMKRDVNDVIGQSSPVTGHELFTSQGW